MGLRRLLIVDGNRAEVRTRQQAAGGSPTAEGFIAALHEIDAALSCDIVRPADEPVRFPASRTLGDYAGVAITGSALNIYDGGEHIERQLELARAVFAAGLPFYGSCWGLQVAVVAAGGVVRANPRGREFGFGRRIALSAAGRAHSMYAGKPVVFEAITVHRDEIAVLPPGSVELAVNESGLQAAEVRSARGVFWGVQYHPEYTFGEIAATAVRYGETLIREGLLRDQSELDAWIADVRLLDADRDDVRLLWRHGLGSALRSRGLQLAEIANWLERQVR